MEIIGKFLEFGVAVEATRGTAKTVAEKWIKNVTANLTTKAEHAIDDNSHGVLADSDNRRVTKKSIEGSVEGIVDANAIGYLMYNLYGSVVSSNVAGSIHSHVFTISNVIEHPSLSFFVKDGGAQQLVFNNGMVNSLEINATPDDFIRFSASLMASEEADNTDTTDYESALDFVGKDVNVKIADTEAGLATAEVVKAKDLGITFDQGLIADYVVGNYSPDDIYTSKMSIEGSFTKNFSDETYKDLFTGDVSKYMEIVIEGSQDLGSENHPTITILLNNIRVTGWDRSGGNDELVTESIEFKAFYNVTDEQQFEVTLQNLIAEYDDPASM